MIFIFVLSLKSLEKYANCGVYVFQQTQTHTQIPNFYLLKNLNISF